MFSLLEKYSGKVGSVRIGTFLPGIERPRKKGTKFIPVKPLIYLGALKFLLNNKLVWARSAIIV